MIKLSNTNVFFFPGSAKYADPETRLIMQNWDVGELDLFRVY